ncbi:MAG: hypothetical protein AAF968_12955 [Pseudomonadota bacterium]
MDGEQDGEYARFRAALAIEPKQAGEEGGQAEADQVEGAGERHGTSKESWERARRGPRLLEDPDERAAGPKDVENRAQILPQRLPGFARLEQWPSKPIKTIV